MTRTLSVTAVAVVVFAAVLYVQSARVVPQPIAGFPPSLAQTAPAETAADEAASRAIEDLAAWPGASGR